MVCADSVIRRAENNRRPRWVRDEFVDRKGRLRDPVLRPGLVINPFVWLPVWSTPTAHPLASPSLVSLPRPRPVRNTQAGIAMQRHPWVFWNRGGIATAQTSSAARGPIADRIETSYILQLSCARGRCRVSGAWNLSEAFRRARTFQPCNFVGCARRLAGVPEK